MTISNATSAAPLPAIPPAPDADTERALYTAATGSASTTPPGDASAGAAAVGTTTATTQQQTLINTLRQALTLLTQLVSQLSGGAASGGGGLVGQQPGQSPVQGPPMKYPSQVGGASGGPVQKYPGQVGGASGPGQYPGQFPGQFPGQYGPGQYGGGAIGGGPTIRGDVELSEGPMSVTLAAGNGDSVKIWGDPHVVLKFDGRTEKFDIGYGAGSITLQDGTRVNWDTGSGNVISNFEVDRPAGVDGDVDADLGDGQKLKDEETFLTGDQLREFADKLRMYEGNAHKPLTRNGGAEGGGSVEGGGAPPKKLKGLFGHDHSSHS